jgi:ferrous iron transport protein A
MKVREKQKRSVADLKPGEKAVLGQPDVSFLQLKLLELGCLPGTPVQVNQGGDPLCITVGSYKLSLRACDARCLTLAD